MTGTSNPPATIEGGGTNLSEYRALLQVLVYASQKSHDAAAVIHDALVGGVVATFFDRQQRIQNGVFLPSSKCIATMAPLIAEGFYSPSLSYTLDNPFSTLYQPLSESYGRDLFTLVILLFPDCFMDGPPMDSHSRTNSLSASAPITPQAVALHSALNISPSVHRESTPSTGTRDANVTKISPLSTYREPTTVIFPSLSVTHANTQALGSGGTLPHAEADVMQLHHYRLQVAAQYLSVINDTLHDVQVRQLKKGKGAALTSSKTTPAEVVNLRVIQTFMEKLKMMLLCCMSASEVVYQGVLGAPESSHKGGSPIQGLENDGMEDPTRYGVPVPLSPMQQLEQLTTQCSLFKHLRWADPVESWNWSESGKEAEEWYDRVLEHVNDVFVKHRQCELETFLFTLKEEALREQGRAITHAPEILMHRATDGHRGVTLELCPSQVPYKPRLPSLPIQNGETHVLLPTSRLCMHSISGDSYVELLFDAATSPFITVLNRWKQKRFTDAQLREETNLFFSTPWNRISEQQRCMIQNYVLSNGFIDKIVEKNPVLLARIVLWSKENVGNESDNGQMSLNVDNEGHNATLKDKNSDEPLVNLSTKIINEVLSGSTFSVSTAHFIRELVARRALDKSIFMAWAQRQCAGFHRNSTSFPPEKTFLALMDFVLVQASWELEPALAAVMQDLRTAAK
ncbi:unnamed protein product [Phytomonas sp. EM1]|nr:unnamed protein product [Phytomonas sp. EM1]|eukprot:CCW59996.1 unnamed protein product [Phytomonas sp. isolate EM1]